MAEQDILDDGKTMILATLVLSMEIATVFGVIYYYAWRNDRVKEDAK